MAHNFTIYGERLSKSRPLAEYPRPQLVRGSYLCLNGPWQYAFTQTAERPAQWDGSILVPFAPESALSGVSRTLQPGEYLWYTRRFTLAAGFLKSRVLLHFGGVDQNCTVYVNGKQAGRHEGGYLPFTFDITKLLRGADNELALVVDDPTDTAAFARGRQKLEYGGAWRSAHSGIWQTVWLESVPKHYIENLRITPRYDEGEVEFLVESGDGDLQGSIEIYARATLASSGSFTSGMPVALPLKGAISWHPRNPFLYTVRISAGDDKVESYFGMRKFAVQKDDEGHSRLMLNNKPFLALGALDEGMFSDGMYTPPSDAAMVADIKFAKECGFNLIRKHGKFEPLRWYHHCDKLGLLVWQDLPAGGLEAKPGLLEKVSGGRLAPKDGNYKRFGREDEAARQAFLWDMDTAARLLYNTPSLMVWVLFQEGRGQFDSAVAADRMRSCDATRLVDAATGPYNTGGGDIVSLPFAPAPPALPEGENRAAVALAGGLGLAVPGHFAGIKPTAAHLCEDETALAAELRALYATLAPLVAQGLCGLVLQSLTDAEDDVSGLITADRRQTKLPPKAVAALNESLAAGLPQGWLK